MFLAKMAKSGDVETVCYIPVGFVAEKGPGSRCIRLMVSQYWTV